MKNNTENIVEWQIAFDGFAQILQEIREAVLTKNKDSENSALNTDLLNKISDNIDNTKKAINAEDLAKFLNAVIAAEMALREKADKAFIEFLNQKIEEISWFVKRPTIIKNHYSIDFKSSKTFIVIVFLSIGLLCSLFGNTVVR